MHDFVMAAAVIYVPADRLIDRQLAGRYWAYLTRRRYEFYSVVRDMNRALQDLEAGAQVVVMMSPAAPRSEPGMTTVVDLAAKRDRMLANEPTVRLPCRGDDGGFADRFLADRRRNSRHMNDT